MTNKLFTKIKSCFYSFKETKTMIFYFNIFFYPNNNSNKTGKTPVLRMRMF